MYSFDYENVVIAHFEPASALFAASCLEVIFRQFHFLAGKQGVELAVQQWYVECVKAFVVVFAVFVPGGFLPVYEVVVERNLHGLDAACQQLDGQALAECGLAA